MSPTILNRHKSSSKLHFYDIHLVPDSRPTAVSPVSDWLTDWCARLVPQQSRRLRPLGVIFLNNCAIIGLHLRWIVCGRPSRLNSEIKT